jgi:hypothetical protein
MDYFMTSKLEESKREKYINKALAIRKALERRASVALFLNIILQFVVLLGATSVPFLLNISEIDKHIPIIISGVVAIATAISTFGRLGERARNLYRAGAGIRREYQLFDLNDKTYRDLSPEDALLHFTKQIELIRNWELESVVASGVYDNASVNIEQETGGRL